MLNKCFIAVVLALVVEGTGTNGNAAIGVAPKELLHYRLAKAKTLHLNDAKTAKSFDESLKKFGCRSELHNHGGHFDLTVHCPEWQSAEFPDHHAVSEWEKWLKDLGFETRHEH